MRNTIITALICLIFAGCSKDKFTTKPQLKYKSANTNVLYPNNSIQFKISYTDAEGDIQDSLYVEKFAFNCVNSRFKQYYNVPAFATTKNSEGDIIVSYSYNQGPYPLIQSPQCFGLNDTCIFRFMLQDKAKNRSDTINSETIVIVHN